MIERYFKTFLILSNLVAQFYYSRAAPTLILWRRLETSDVWMIGEHPGDCLSQCAGAVTVNYPNFTRAVQECFVKKLIGQIYGFIGLPANQIKFGAALEFGV